MLDAYIGYRTLIPRVTLEKEAWQRKKDEEDEAINTFVEGIKRRRVNENDMNEETESRETDK